MNLYSKLRSKLNIIQGRLVRSKEEGNKNEVQKTDYSAVMTPI